MRGMRMLFEIYKSLIDNIWNNITFILAQIIDFIYTYHKFVASSTIITA
jgi:hypothetical protein